MNNEIENFLVRSLILKPEEKSSRRFCIRMKRLCRLNAPTPESRTKEMLILPETSLVGYIGEGRLAVQNRYSAISPADDLPTPIVDISNKFASLMENVDGLTQRVVTRTTTWNELQHLSYSREYRITPMSQLAPFLTRDYTITCGPGQTFNYRSGKDEFHLARLGDIIVPTKSAAPKDLLRGGFMYWIDAWETLNDQSERQLAEGCVEIVSLCLRTFQLQLDFLNKQVYHMCKTQNIVNKRQHQRIVLSARLETLNVLCELVEGPLSCLLKQSDHQDQSRPPDLFFQLRHRITAVEKLLSKLESSHPVEPEELFDWQLCTFEESSAEWWIRLNSKAPDQIIRDFISHIKLYLGDDRLGAIHQRSISHQEVKVFMSQTYRLLNVWSNLMQLIRRADKILISRSIIQDSRFREYQGGQKNPNQNPLSLRTIPFTNSFTFPFKSSKEKGIVQLSRRGLIGNFVAKVDGWYFEIVASRNPYPQQFSNYFTQDEHRFWRFRYSFAPPECVATDPAVPDFWECFQADFCPKFYFLLFATPTELRILLMGTTPTDEIERLCCTIVESPSQDLSHTDFLEKVKFFYNELHEPHRSETFTWVESQKCLLWAVPLISDPKVKEGFVDICLCLRAYSLEEKELKVKTQLTSDNDRQWMFIIPGLAGKSEMDPRHNPNLSFYFSWRRTMSRILGVWLRSEGGYRIYTLTKKRFVLCCQKLNRPFVDHFMTELIPAIPGLFGDAPMLLKRNNTIRVCENSCDFELTELRLVMN